MRILILGKHSVLSGILQQYLKDGGNKLGQMTGDCGNILRKIKNGNIDYDLVIDITNDPYTRVSEEYNHNIELINYLLEKTNIKVIVPITFPTYNDIEYQNHLDNVRSLSSDRLKVIYSDIIGISSIKGNGLFNRVTEKDSGSTLSGSADRIHNGVVSYNICEIVGDLVNSWNSLPNVVVPYTDPYNEYELFNYINEIFNDKSLYDKSLSVKKSHTKSIDNSVMGGNLHRGSIKDQLLKYRDIKFPKVKFWKKEQ